MKNCLPGEGSRAGTLETVLDGLGVTAEHDSANRRVYAELSITGLARFLSHAELLKGLERSCVRAGIDLHYSQGFNPRPHISVPLPKSVGLESTGDVLCLRLRQAGHAGRQELTRQSIHERLSAELPQGISMLSLRMTSSRCSLQPYSARWTIPFHASKRSDTLRETVCRLLASDTIQVVRSQPSKPHQTKRKNIRQYLSSIETTPESIQVAYRITPQGSVRLDEVLTLLGLDPADLEGPIQRSHIQWRFI